MRILALALALAGAMFLADSAHAASVNGMEQVYVCDPTVGEGRSNCLKPNADGSINTSGGGGGGGDASAANQVTTNAALGAPADSVCATSTGTCTIIALLKKVADWLEDMVTAMLTPAEIIPSTSGGLSIFYLTAANSTNATNVKASAGQLYSTELSNNSATPAYVSFYNTAGTPTCGTGIVAQAMIPANSTSGAGWVSNSLHGKAFGTGIGICVTTGIAGTGSVAASAYTITLGYK